jgi:hypothetical protein
MDLDRVAACTLPTAERPLRVAEFADLFTTLSALDRRDPGRLRLHLAGAPGLAERVRDLTAREAECCSFFDFDLAPDGPGLVLDVRVPAAHADVLDGLERLARGAR